MIVFIQLAPLLLAGLATARQCSNLLIPISITSRQGIFQQIPIETNLDVSAFKTRYNQYQKNLTATLLQGYQTLQSTYTISAQYCQPDGYGNGVIQILTHGIGFDKTYWDLDYNNYQNSYVNNALQNGFATLAIDRLGIGNSSHGDPLNEIQAQAEVEALNAVTTLVRNANCNGITTSYKKIIHIGHSFGSTQTLWLSALYPQSSDGLVLTGFSAAGAMFNPYFMAGANYHSARLNQPFRFGNASNAGVRALAAQYQMSDDVVPGLQSLLQSVGVQLSTQQIWDIVATTEILDLTTGYNKTIQVLDYPSGYITSADLTATIYLFLYPGTFDVALALMGEQIKQPVTVGELLTSGSAPKTSTFAGPVFVLTGEYDVPFCGGNCFAQLPNAPAAPSLPAGVKAAFPNASTFEAYVQPATGHGLTFSNNATAGYRIIQNWLGANGLGSQK